MVETENSSVAAIILAAGKSQRMGRSKILLSVGHQTLLGYQIEQFRALNLPLYIVVGHQGKSIIEAHQHYPDIHWVFNSNYEQGMSSSVRKGFQALAPVIEAVFFTPVDHLTHISVLQQLLAVYKLRQSLITSPLIRGRKGHPILFHHALFDEIKTIDEKTEGLRAIVRKYNDSIQTVPVDWLGAKLDLDTPEDYLQMMTYLKSRAII